MKVRLYLSLLMISILSVVQLTGQQNDVVRCYTTETDAQLRAQYPELGTLEDFEAWLEPLVREYQENSSMRAVSTIPIIFHVIHDGEAVGFGDNISATYINAQITQLNNDFRKIAGTSGDNSNPVGADTEIEFCAATIDPSGNTLAEPGINRINRSSKGWTAPPYGSCTGGFNNSYIQNTIKPQSQWNPDDYLNIWVMDINCGILGYAQFPSSSGLGGLNSNGGAANTDGVVVLTTSVGSTTIPNPAGGSYNKGRTLTHEIGHFFGLRHIWGDGGCTVDDFCADTPTSDAANYGCPTGHVSCNSTDMIENYMDYTDDTCMNIYTNDQKARMQTVLSNSPRRGSLANSGACGSGGGGGGCTATVSSFPYSEGFESSFGQWTQESGDDFDWSRNSGGTPSSNTGPSAAAAGSFYAYMESSSPNYSNKNAILNSPCFDLSGASTATFSFQYHMYGATAMGSLSLQARTSGGTWTTVWSKSGNQGNSWLSANVNLDAYAGSTMELRFNGTTGTTWQGDMAVDALSLSTSGGGGGGGCTGGISSLPYSEGFESSFGVWTQDSGDDFDWTRRSGSTPSSNTGPSSASEGSFYAYMESSSPNYSSKTAILNSPCIDLSGESTVNFDFMYHMYGSTAMGNLLLQARTGGGAWTTVWSKSGNQGNSWQAANVDLSAYGGDDNVELRFFGTTGTTWQGDMAIDDLSLSSSGGGGGGCTDVTVTITLDNYPEETSWSIVNSSGTTVASGGTYGSQPDGSTINVTNCLPDGCYDFIINDAYGDGICCSYGNGSYTVTGGGSTLASGGAFGASETTNFCLSGGTRIGQSRVETTDSKESLTCFPNPAREVLNINYESKIDGQVSLKVMNLVGQVISANDLYVTKGQNTHQLDLNAMNSGTYIMLVENEESSVSQRFIIID
jgi:hypothetical protein